MEILLHTWHQIEVGFLPRCVTPANKHREKNLTTERNERNLESRDPFALCVAGLGVGVLKYASPWNTMISWLVLLCTMMYVYKKDEVIFGEDAEVTLIS